MKSKLAQFTILGNKLERLSLSNFSTLVYYSALFLKPLKAYSSYDTLHGQAPAWHTNMTDLEQ